MDDCKFFRLLFKAIVDSSNTVVLIKHPQFQILDVILLLWQGILDTFNYFFAALEGYCSQIQVDAAHQAGDGSQLHVLVAALPGPS